MSLASARLLMLAATVGRTHAASLTSRLGFAATFTRCAPLRCSLIHTQRGFASVAGSSSVRLVAPSSAASTSAPSPSSPSTPLSTLRSQLLGCVKSQRSADAERLILEFEELGGRCDVAMLNQWISCHEKAGNWQGAERVWARLGELRLKPSNHSVRALLQVYTHAGGEQLAKIEPLLSEMRQYGVAFSVHDFEHLIKAAHRSKLPAEVRRWSELARAAGLFDSLDETSRNIVTFPANRAASAVSAASDASPSSAVSASIAAAPSATAVDRAAVYSQLKRAMEQGEPATAAQLITAFEQRGGRCDVAMLNMWIKCHKKAGDGQGAERVWARFGELGLKPNCDSFAALMQVYTSAGGEQLAKIDRLLSEMQTACLHFSVTDYQHLIKSAHQAKQSAEVRRWADLARAAGLRDQLDEATRRIIANSTLEIGASDGESSLQRWSAMSDEHKRDSSLALSKLLSDCAATGDSAAAERIIADCDRLGIAMDVFDLTAWIGCCRIKGDWQRAERAWKRFGQLSLKPNSVSYTALLQVYTQAGGEHLAKITPLLSQIRRSNVRFSAKDYSNLIKTAHRCMLPAEVRRWSELARAAGLFDSMDETSRIVTFPANRAASAVSAASDASPSSAVSASIAAAPSATAVDRAAVYSQLKRAMEQGEPATAAQLITAFEQRGGRCDVAMLNMWISCHEKRGDWKGAEQVWAQFDERNLTPDSYSCAALMQVYTSAGGDQLDKIEPMLGELQTAGLAFTAAAYQQLIKSAHRAKQSAEVRRWAAHSRAAGLWDQLDTVSRGIVAVDTLQEGASGGQSLLQRWMRMSDQQKRDNSLALPKLLADLASNGQSAEAESILADCDRIGVTLTVDALNAWIGCYQSKGDWQAAERVWQRFDQLSIKPARYSFTALLQVYTHAGGEQLAKIESLLSEMEQSGVQLSSKDYERLIKSAHRCKLPAEVRRWSELARAAGLFDALDQTSRSIATHPANRQPSSLPVETRPASVAAR